MGGYTIAYAMLLIMGARLGDRFGRRRTYLAGVIIFTTASLACALAPDSQVLVAFRFIQGAGPAAVVPQVFRIIQLAFTGQAPWHRGQPAQPPFISHRADAEVLREPEELLPDIRMTRSTLRDIR